MTETEVGEEITHHSAIKRVTCRVGISALRSATQVLVGYAGNNSINTVSQILSGNSE